MDLGTYGQNVILDTEMAYIETEADGRRYLMVVIPFPTEAMGWLNADKTKFTRVTAINAVNGIAGYVRAGLTDRNDIGGLDDPTAKLEVKLIVSPLVARDTLGMKIHRSTIGDKAEAQAARPDRGEIAIDDLARVMASAVDKSRKAGPVTTVKHLPFATWENLPMSAARKRIGELSPDDQERAALLYDIEPEPVPAPASRGRK